MCYGGRCGSTSFLFILLLCLRGLQTFWTISYLIFLFHICLAPFHNPKVLKWKMSYIPSSYLIEAYMGPYQFLSSPQSLTWNLTLLGKVVLDFITVDDGYLPRDVLCSLHVFNASLNHHNIIGYYFHFAGDKTEFQRAYVICTKSCISGLITETKLCLTPMITCLLTPGCLNTF